MSNATTVMRLRQGIAEEIRVLLARRRMSATKLAQDLGWSQPYMERPMVGAQPFDVDDLEAIAEELSVQVVDLLPKGPSTLRNAVTPMQLDHPLGRDVPAVRLPSQPAARRTAPTGARLSVTAM